jgi:predicted homoserine dehydrogenase-like protein
MRRDVKKDSVVSFDDVERPAGGLVEELWKEQNERWPQQKQVPMQSIPVSEAR